MKNENVGPLVQNYQEFSTQWQKNIKPSTGSLYKGVLLSSGHTPNESSPGPSERNELEACHTGCSPSLDPLDGTTTEPQRYGK